MKDFNHYAFIGFFFSFIALPAILAKREDAIGQEEMAISEDPEQTKKASENIHEMGIRAAKNQPQVKIMLSGIFHDMIKRGVFSK